MLDKEAPEVDPAVRRAFDVQIDLHVGLRYLDRTDGLSIKRDAFEQHPRPAGRDPDAPFSAAAVADLRQIPLQKLIKLSVNEVGDRRNAMPAERGNFAHVQRRLVDAQADVIRVELRQAVLPPLAARSILC